MGGKLRDGYVIVGGVVKKDVRGFFDELVRMGRFESRSGAIGHVLTEFAKKHQTKGVRRG